MTKYVFASIGEVILCDVRSYYKCMMMTLVNFVHELARIMTRYDFSRISEMNFSDIRTYTNFM